MLDSLRKVIEIIKDGGIAVIDEFQRVPLEFWDYLALARQEAPGRLILCGSSMAIVRRVFDRRSPLLGLFKPVKIDLISPKDVLKSLTLKLNSKEDVLWSPLVRDPWILNLVEPTGSPVKALIANHSSLTASVSGLIGEVFEEERMLTRLYDATLRLLALGYWSSRDLAQKLYEARLIERPEPGVVTGLLNQMSKMGLVEGIKLWRTRGLESTID